MRAANTECYADPRFDHNRVGFDDPQRQQGVQFSAAMFEHQFSAAMVSRGMRRIDDDDSPSESAAVYSLGLAERRARAEVSQLKRRGLIKDSVARDSAKIIKFLFKPNTVYASIAHDDNGLIFYWRARDMSIEIDVFTGDGFWWAVTNVGEESYEGSGYTLAADRLKHSLNQFSKEVESANPNWRNQAT